MTWTPLFSIRLLQRLSDNFGPLPSKMPRNGTGSGKSADEEADSPLLRRWKVACRKCKNLVWQARMRRGMLARNAAKDMEPSKSGTSPTDPRNTDASGIGKAQEAAFKPLGGACASGAAHCCSGKTNEAMEPAGSLHLAPEDVTVQELGLCTRVGLLLRPLLPLLESPTRVLKVRGGHSSAGSRGARKATGDGRQAGCWTPALLG